VEFLFGFLEEEKLNVGGGECEIDAPQSNKCEFNHSSHITFTFAFFNWQREIYKMIISRCLVLSGTLFES